MTCGLLFGLLVAKCWMTGISGGSDLGFYVGFGSVVVVISYVYFLGYLANASIYIYNLTTCHNDALCLSIKSFGLAEYSKWNSA